MPPPPKYTDPQVRARVLEALRMGASIDDASVYAGMSKHTLHGLLTDGRKLADEHPDHPKATLAADVAAVRNQVKLESMALVRQSARDRVTETGQRLRGEWKAAAWWLERRHPDEFALRREGVNPERAAGLLGVLMDRVLSDPRLGLTPAQRQGVPEILHEHLDALTSEAAAVEPAG